MKNTSRKTGRFYDRLRKACMILCIACLICAVLLISSDTAQARTETLTVKAGYWGMPQVTKGVFSHAEIEEAGAEYMYTYFNAIDQIIYCDTLGITVEDLLGWCGVDPGAVEYINFAATDNHYRDAQFYIEDLIYTPRYAFPELIKYANEEINEDELWAGSIPVPAMIASKGTFRRAAFDEEYVKEELDDPSYENSCFRLYFGQASPDESSASASIQDIYEVNIVYYGFPSLESDDVEIRVGEDNRIEVSVVDSYEEEITQMILDGLVFESSDPSVVEVDEYGRLTAKQVGEAEITISYTAGGGTANDAYLEKTIRIKVNAADEGTGGTGEEDGSGDEDGGEGGESGDPGNGNTDPGNKNDDPGNENTDPGNGNTDPGNENTDPGNENTDPGNENTDPGNKNTDPGNENDDPGRQNDSENPSKEEGEPFEDRDNNESQSAPAAVPAQENASEETGFTHTENDNADLSADTSEHQPDPEIKYLSENVQQTDSTEKEKETADATVTARRIYIGGSGGGTKGGGGASGGSSGGSAGESKPISIELEQNHNSLFLILFISGMLAAGAAGMFADYKREFDSGKQKGQT